MEYRVSNSQLNELLDHLASNPILVKGASSGPRAKEVIDREWSELAERLNAHRGGAAKTGTRWKRYWADLKHKVKTRAIARRRNTFDGTEEEISELDKRVLAIIEESALVKNIPLIGNSGDTQDETGSDLGHDESTDFEAFFMEAPDEDAKDEKPLVTASPARLGNCSRKRVYSPSPPDDRILRRRLYAKQTSKNSLSTKFQPKVVPSWVVDFENRRLRAEEKLAEATFIMAEASRAQASAAQTQADAAMIQAEAAKTQADAVRTQAEAVRTQAEAAKTQAEAAKKQAEASQTHAEAMLTLSQTIANITEKLKK